MRLASDAERSLARCARHGDHTEPSNYARLAAVGAALIEAHLSLPADPAAAVTSSQATIAADAYRRVHWYTSDTYSAATTGLSSVG